MFLDEIADYLATNGVGTVGKDIFKGSNAAIPDGAGPYLIIYETGGSGGLRIHNERGTHVQRPSAQISVRAKSYKDARVMAKAAYLVLDGVWNTTIGGVFYQKIVARQEPNGNVGVDSVGRPLVQFNIDAEKAPS